MTTPLERLIAAVRAHCGADECGGLAELRAALAALPATPPEQPVPDEEREAFLPPFDHCETARDVVQQLGFEMKEGYLSPANQAKVDHAATCIEALMRSAPAPQPVPAPSIGESLASAGTHYVNPRTMQPVSTKVPAPPASDWRTDLGVTGNIGTGTVLP